MNLRVRCSQAPVTGTAFVIGAVLWRCGLVIADCKTVAVLNMGHCISVCVCVCVVVVVVVAAAVRTGALN